MAAGYFRLRFCNTIDALSSLISDQWCPRIQSFSLTAGYFILKKISPSDTALPLWIRYHISGYDILYLRGYDIASPDITCCISGYDILHLRLRYCISGYDILHLRVRHIASPVTILHLRVRHVASPVTILHLRVRHVASPVTILHLRVRHIASPDTILHLRVRYITSPGTTYCTPHTRYYISGYEITYEIRHNTAHGILQFCPQSPSII